MKRVLPAIIILFGVVGLTIDVYGTAIKEMNNLWNGLALFRYYTLQSNLIVILYFALGFSSIKNSDIYIRFLGGITVYITITFIIFLFFLQKTYQPQGMFVLSNILLHYLVPILTITYLVLCRNELQFKTIDLLYWIIYPVLYVIFMIIHGVITNDYLYPFFQVSNVGVNGLVIMVVFLVLFFLVLSFLLMKIVSKKELT